jgi:hypothetical protein
VLAFPHQRVARIALEDAEPGQALVDPRAEGLAELGRLDGPEAEREADALGEHGLSLRLVHLEDDARAAVDDRLTQSQGDDLPVGLLAVDLPPGEPARAGFFEVVVQESLAVLAEGRGVQRLEAQDDRVFSQHQDHGAGLIPDRRRPVVHRERRGQEEDGEGHRQDPTSSRPAKSSPRRATARIGMPLSHPDRDILSMPTRGGNRPMISFPCEARSVTLVVPLAPPWCQKTGGSTGGRSHKHRIPMLPSRGGLPTAAAGKPVLRGGGRPSLRGTRTARFWAWAAITSTT